MVKVIVRVAIRQGKLCVKVRGFWNLSGNIANIEQMP